MLNFGNRINTKCWYRNRDIELLSQDSQDGYLCHTDRFLVAPGIVWHFVVAFLEEGTTHHRELSMDCLQKVLPWGLFHPDNCEEVAVGWGWRVWKPHTDWQDEFYGLKFLSSASEHPFLPQPFLNFFNCPSSSLTPSGQPKSPQPNLNHLRSASTAAGQP